MKEKKSLLITSLLSVSMSISVMAANKSMEHGDKLTTTVTTINTERNTLYPKTDNTKALYTADKDGNYRVKEYNESFPFIDASGKVVNIDDSIKPATVSNLGYKLVGNETVNDTTGFISGHKEVEDAGNINNGNSGRYFRYWNSTANSIDDDNKPYTNDGQYSPSFPKLCYKLNYGSYPSASYPTKITKKTVNGASVPDTPLIRLASVGGDINGSKKMEYLQGNHRLQIPAISADKLTVEKNGIQNIIWTQATNNYAFEDNTLTCDTNTGCTLTWIGSCFKINPRGEIKKVDPNNIIGYDYVNRQNINYSKIVNCSTKTNTGCSQYDAKSFRGDSSNDAYRISQFVSLDISGNTDVIEIPDQTCYKCLPVQTSGVEDTSCAYIVNEVFKEKGGNCAQTVAALATNPRMVKDSLPANLNNDYNCKSCLCKIEGLLKAKGCN